jgi:hypothetical protein
MSWKPWLVVAAFGIAAGAASAETVYEPGHRTWTNSYVPPHYVNKPDTRYVPPRNQPLDPTQSQSGATGTANAPAPPPSISVYTPPPYLNPYYNALDAASRPSGPLKLHPVPPPH